MMIIALLPLLLLLLPVTPQKIQASLQIITYQPLLLNLSFTQPIPLPQFQLLFNEIPIGKNLLHNYDSKNYIIEGITEGIVRPEKYLTEKYVVMFTEPLNIMNGGLNLDSFLLRAYRPRNTTEYMLQPISEKPSHYKFQNFSQVLNTLALIICILVYFLAYTTVIGLSAFNFLAIYVYISLKSFLFTALDYKMAYYLFMDIHVLQQDSIYQIIYLGMPLLLILFSFLVSLVSRLALAKLAERSGLCNYIYYYFTYRFFIITWEIMCIPLFTTTAHTLFEIGKEPNPETNTVKYGFAYVNVLVIVFYLYMSYFTSNPQIGENQEKWSVYVESSHFQLYDGFHLGTEPENRIKRNYKFIYSLVKLITLIFITVSSSQIPNIVFNVMLLVYLFTVRPFQYNFFNNFNIVIESVIIIFYLYRYIVELYFGISQEIGTSNDLARILLTNIVLVSGIVLTFFVMAVYEFYQRLRVFKINMSAWRHNKYINEEGIRKTKKSAFEREKIQNENQNTLESTKPKKKHSNSPLPPLNQSKRDVELKTPRSESEKSDRSKRMVKEKTSGKKSRSKLKQKSSLLQSISMEAQQQ